MKIGNENEYFIFIRKLGFNLFIWKNIEKNTSTFINRFDLHPFKNIIRYIHFFITQITDVNNIN